MSTPRHRPAPCPRTAPAGPLRRVALLAFALLLSTLLATAATLLAFTVTLDGGDARVEWEVSTEADVMGFDLARRGLLDPTYEPLTSIVPTGQRRYVYTDHNAYRSAGPFTYRLIVRGGPSGEQASYTTTLAPTPSAMQRSWGTIKSMFR